MKKIMMLVMHRKTIRNYRKWYKGKVLNVSFRVDAVVATHENIFHIVDKHKVFLGCVSCCGSNKNKNVLEPKFTDNCLSDKITNVIRYFNSNLPMSLCCTLHKTVMFSINLYISVL